VIGRLRAQGATRVQALLSWASIWLIVALFSACWIVTANRATHGDERWGHALWLNLGSYAIWALLTIPLVRLSRRVAWRPSGRWYFIGYRALLATGFAVLHSAIFVLLLTAGRSLSTFFQAYGVAFSHTLRFNFHFELLTALLILFASESLGWYRRYRQQSLRTARLVEQLAKTRFEAARLQLHPHFVFNALNSVAEMLYVDAAEAERLVLRLSSLLRTMLERSPDQLVPLRVELDFVRRYLEIEHVRFGDRLNWTVDATSDALEAEVPAMLLQPLIDNAIVHGIARLDRGGELRLLAEVVAGRLHLVLTNDTTQRVSEHSGEPSTHGLAATRAKLDHFFGAGHANLRNELLANRTRFRVSLSLPLGAATEPLMDKAEDRPLEVVWTRN